MITGYSYDVWNGKEVIGHYFSMFRLSGTHIVIPAVSPFKESYFRKPEMIKIPLIPRMIYDDGVEIRYRITMDVRKKSKRQINIILGKK